MARQPPAARPHVGWLLRGEELTHRPDLLAPWIQRSLLWLAALPLIGTLGYAFIEGWSLFDSLYMAVITVTTIGYGETHPLSDAGRLFTIVFILGSVGIVGKHATDLARYVAEGGFSDGLRVRRARRDLMGLHGHVVVVGYGRLGREIVAELLHHGNEVVVIDKTAPEVPELGVRLIVGDAASDDTLRAAGVERARALAIATPSDAVNVYVTLSARQLSPSLVIHTRVEEEGAASKARRAGANAVVMPYHLGGSRMAMGLTRPASLDFVERATQRHFDDLHMDDVIVGPTTKLVGRLGALDLHRTRGVSVVALRKPGEAALRFPDADANIETDDLLVVVGAPGQVEAFVADVRR